SPGCSSCFGSARNCSRRSGWGSSAWLDDCHKNPRGEPWGGQREERERLPKAARRRKIDIVLVWRLDRWGRSVTGLLATLQELEHLGAGFVSLTEALDLTTAGRAMAGLLRARCGNPELRRRATFSNLATCVTSELHVLSVGDGSGFSAETRSLAGAAFQSFRR